MEFAAFGVLRGVTYKPAKGGPVVVITQGVDATRHILGLGMFCGQEVKAIYKTSRGEHEVNGTLLKVDSRPGEHDPEVQIQLQAPAAAELGELGMSSGKNAQVVYRPWQLALEDEEKGAKKRADGQMPLATVGGGES